MMKLSAFLQKKKIVFNGGIPKIITPMIEGELIFYNMERERIEKLNKEVVQKLEAGTSKEMVAYKMFPYFASIECDVPFEKFVSMVNFPPNNEFAVVLDVFYESMENIFAQTETMAKLEEKSEKMMERVGENPAPKAKTKEELKKEIEEELDSLEATPENKPRRKELFLKLAELED